MEKPRASSQAAKALKNYRRCSGYKKRLPLTQAFHCLARGEKMMDHTDPAQQKSPKERERERRAKFSGRFRQRIKVRTAIHLPSKEQRIARNGYSYHSSRNRRFERWSESLRDHDHERDGASYLHNNLMAAVWMQFKWKRVPLVSPLRVVVHQSQSLPASSKRSLK